MNNTIWKYQFNLADEVEVELPFGCEILDIQIASIYAGPTGVFELWALVDSNEDRMFKNSFRIYGTGHECNENMMDYIKTVRDGPLVWHIFR